MDHKQIWTITGVSLIAVLAVAFVSGAIYQGPFFGPKTSTTSTEARIKANSCDADDTCEINNALVNGNLIVEGIIENDLNVECEIFDTEEKNGLNTCINHGYTSCLFEEHYKQITYFDSIDNCEGEIQSQSIYPELRQCPMGAGGGGLGCLIHTSGKEPYIGGTLMGDYVYPDSFEDVIPPKVLCCRKKS